MDARGTYRTVLQRIVLLSDKQREVMGRCAIAGQLLGDAAKEMRIQVTTARVHLYRARQALKMSADNCGNLESSTTARGGSDGQP